jgi:hypothetical protein
MFFRVALFLVGAAIASSNATAGQITATEIVNNWPEGPTPLDGGPSLLPLITWTVVNGGIETTNGSGMLSSNFSLSGDFTFSLWIQPITPEFADNDLFGVAFGFQDLSNNYRFGWGAGGYRDTGVGGTGADGLYLVKEAGGVGSILYNDANLRWENNVEYDVTVFRSGSDIGFSVIRVSDSQLIAAQTVSDSMFTEGQVGIWVESQTTRFSNFDVSSVPEPSGIWLLAIGLSCLGITVAHRTSTNHHPCGPAPAPR